MNVTFSPLSETLCYQLLYGTLIDCVPHYKKRSFFRIISNEPHKLIISCVGGGGGGSDGGMKEHEGASVPYTLEQGFV